jgi:hypothetical protein
MPGTMTEADLVDDLKRSLHDAGSSAVFNGAGQSDWKRLLRVALVAMQTKRPRTLLGQITLVADEPRYPLNLANFAQYKTYIWGARQLQPWDPCYPGALPRVHALQEGALWSLAFDPQPSQAHINAYGSTFKFWYFATHSLGELPEDSTLSEADRPLLLLRAQAEALRELTMHNVNKPVQLKDGLTGAPRNSTPAALYQALLQEWEAAR